MLYETNIKKIRKKQQRKQQQQENKIRKERGAK
jgi:hypothetical protein